MMREIDPEKIKHLEKSAREIGSVVGNAINRFGATREYGFCLMLFSYEGPELTWISSGNREDMIKVLDEFKEKLLGGNANEHGLRI